VVFAEKPPPRELWMLMRPDVARLARVRAVADHLVQVFEETSSGSEDA
jgi:DNA-binding transcriptional LysR family regulator